MTPATVYYIKKEMHALASKMYILATGLQNAAPPGTSGKSIEYLMAASQDLQRVSEHLQTLLPEGDEQARPTMGRREP